MEEQILFKLTLIKKDDKFTVSTEKMNGIDNLTIWECCGISKRVCLVR